MEEQVYLQVFASIYVTPRLFREKATNEAPMKVKTPTRRLKPDRFAYMEKNTIIPCSCISVHG
jgi:hypothetical protein